MAATRIGWGATGSIGPTGPTGSTGCTGPTGPTGYSNVQCLSNEQNVEITYSHYVVENSHFTIKGSIKEVSLLILKRALELQELHTSVFDDKKQAPSYVSWGPFTFDVTSDLKPIFSPSNTNFSIQDVRLTLQILEELENLQKLKAFW